MSNDSPFYAPPIPLEQIPPKEDTPREAKPTAQIPFEKWYDIVNDIVIAEEVELGSSNASLVDMRDEFYSYLRG